MDNYERDRLTKVRSESVGLKASQEPDSSLPRGEYMQPPISPKLNKNLVKLKPLESKKSFDSDESFDGSLQNLDKIGKDSRTTSDSSSTPSGDNTPTPRARHLEKKMSTFSKRKIIDVEAKTVTNIEKTRGKPDDSYYTPKVDRQKKDLYKISLMQNASKGALDRAQPNTTTNAQSEEYKRNSARKLTEVAKQKKDDAKFTLQKRPGGFQSLVIEEKTPVQIPLSAKSLVFSPKVDDKILKKHIMLIFRGLNYSLKLLKPPPLSYVESRQIVVKDLKVKNQKTLLLDLDETLITSCSSRDDPEKSLQPADGGPPILIKVRPFAREFLRKMKEHFEIMVFTASCTSYAETIVKELDPDKKYISYIFDRNFCLETKNGFYIKDLRIIKNRELKNMVLVDNLVHSFGFQIENGIPIIEWTGNKADTELKFLMDYLLELKKHDDVRDFNRQKLRLHELGHAKIEDIMDF